MTRIAGVDVVVTPCCRRTYGTTAYASINFSAWEYWTDGQDHQGLAPPLDGLRRCSCGEFFLIRRAEKVGFIPQRSVESRRSNVVSLSQRASEKSSNWIRAMFGLPEASSNTQPTAAEGSIASAVEVPESAPRVPNSDLKEVIDACSADPEMEVVARRRLWRHLNDPYRDVYRAHRDGGAQDFPPFTPSEEQCANMSRLLELLSPHEDLSSMEIAELLRELGDSAQASKFLGEVTAESPFLARVIQECLKRGFQGPARYRI
jgi:hypothetical protein